MAPSSRLLSLEDLRLARTPEGLRTLFARLGYAVLPEPGWLQVRDLDFGAADAANVRAAALIATQGDPATASSLQVLYVEVAEVALARLRSLARDLLARGAARSAGGGGG